MMIPVILMSLQLAHHPNASSNSSTKVLCMVQTKTDVLSDGFGHSSISENAVSSILLSLLLTVPLKPVIAICLFTMPLHSSVLSSISVPANQWYCQALTGGPFSSIL